MNITDLLGWATDKSRFATIRDYLEFATAFLEYRESAGFQAELVSRNTPQYRFFQYKADAGFQLTRCTTHGG